MKLLLIAIGIVLLHGCSSIEEPEIYYLSRRELIADNAIARGWVPSWFPASVSAIHVATNIDTNEVWMRFRLDPGELRRITACQKDTGTAFEKANLPRVKRSWWVKPEGTDWEGYTCRWEQDGKETL